MRNRRSDLRSRSIQLQCSRYNTKEGTPPLNTNEHRAGSNWDTTVVCVFVFTPSQVPGLRCIGDNNRQRNGIRCSDGNNSPCNHAAPRPRYVYLRPVLYLAQIWLTLRGCHPRTSDVRLIYDNRMKPSQDCCCQLDASFLQISLTHTYSPRVKTLSSATPTSAEESVAVFVDKMAGADILLEQFGGSQLVVRDARV